MAQRRWPLENKENRNTVMGGIASMEAAKLQYIWAQLASSGKELWAKRLPKKFKPPNTKLPGFIFGRQTKGSRGLYIWGWV